MKRLLLPPFLPLLVLLVFLLFTALVTGTSSGTEGDEPLRWVMFVPMMMIWLYPFLFAANGIDAWICERFEGTRWVSMFVTGGLFGALYCSLLTMRAGERDPDAPNALLLCVAATVACFTAVVMMSLWRRAMMNSSKGAGALQAGADLDDASR